MCKELRKARRGATKPARKIMDRKRKKKGRTATKAAALPREFETDDRSDNDVLKNAVTIRAKDARTKFSKVVDAARVDDDRIVVTNHGAPVVAIVPISDLRMLNLLDDLGVRDRIEDKSMRSVSPQKFKQVVSEQ